MIKRKGRNKTKDQKKKEVNEDLDYLRQVDQLPEDQGRDFVADYETDKNKREQKESDEIANLLQTQQNARFTYRRNLALYAVNKIDDAQIPLDWAYTVQPTDGGEINIFNHRYNTQEGLVFILRSPKGNIYLRAIKTTHLTEYDMNAVHIMVVQMENTVDSEKGLLLSDNNDTAGTMKKTDSGIFIK